ncbi:MAG TPA: HAMP domain-containing sensor histidine kinase [Candidatus Limnocylindrales bacterium]|nr:HAMP domain-containing sensor histidine kinase [Candidatus Limnocylindrales bacterium]
MTASPPAGPPGPPGPPGRPDPADQPTESWWGGPRGRRPRPPWWPADEPWPPARRHRPWRRFGCAIALVILLGVAGLIAIAASLAGSIAAAPGPGGHLLRFAAAVAAILVLLGLVRGGRAFRGSSLILDDLVEQAAKVEAGDYAARVEPTGRVAPPVRDLVRGFNTMAARLEADETQRRRLLADVTHELRTPLTVIAGNVEAILDGVHPADEAHLGAILDETRVLDRLIDDLRTLALSEAGSLSLHREPTDLDVLLAEVVTSFGAAAETGGVALGASVDHDVPLLDVDPVRLREVLANLVSNALRHTPRGGRVQLAARMAPGDAARSTSGARTAEITVTDTGAGIDPALLPHVFERFARGADSTGMGLGLAIARGLVELHGGTIAAASGPAGGTTITIRLPISPA